MDDEAERGTTGGRGAEVSGDRETKVLTVVEEGVGSWDEGFFGLTLKDEAEDRSTDVEVALYLLLGGMREEEEDSFELATGLREGSDMEGPYSSHSKQKLN
jgi:hypothetical protein